MGWKTKAAPSFNFWNFLINQFLRYEIFCYTDGSKLQGFFRLVDVFVYFSIANVSEFLETNERLFFFLSWQFSWVETSLVTIKLKPSYFNIMYVSFIPQNALRAKLEMRFQAPRSYVVIRVKWITNYVDILQACREFKVSSSEVRFRNSFIQMKFRTSWKCGAFHSNFEPVCLNYS